jgi:hypothetical protein
MKTEDWTEAVQDARADAIQRRLRVAVACAFDEELHALTLLQAPPVMSVGLHAIKAQVLRAFDLIFELPLPAERIAAGKAMPWDKERRR